MRFLGVGDSCDLGALYLRLIAEGHEVKVYVSKALCHGTLAGMVERVEDWHNELAWVRKAGDEGIILFENVEEKRGALQDELRGDGFNVIGGSSFGDRLENDRGFAQAVLADLGLSILPVKSFDRRSEAIEYIKANPRRWVIKFNSAAATFIGQLPQGDDVVAYLEALPAQATSESFILMEHVEGVEMGIGAYFDGEKFLTPSCLDWEHKRFFPGDLGELTGQMGDIVTYERSSRFHELTLGRMQEQLRQSGYLGYINLNTIVNEDGVWPLEFTCRFGYPGFAVLDPLQQLPWSELFHMMVARTGTTFPTRSGFAAGVVLTTPPFPYSRPDVQLPVGMPILFDNNISEEERRHIHYGEVGLENGRLVTSGAYGWTMVVTGVGPSVLTARDRANQLAGRIHIPNVRYRRDIGERLHASDWARIERLGLLSAINSS
jgi:phosphoribosylamine---glycine ligase